MKTIIHLLIGLALLMGCNKTQQDVYKLNIIGCDGYYFTSLNDQDLSRGILKRNHVIEFTAQPFDTLKYQIISSQHGSIELTLNGQLATMPREIRINDNEIYYFIIPYND